MIRETPLQSAEQLHDAALRMGEEIEALQRFLSSEIEKSNARLAPCVCGHVAMFCACREPANHSNRI